MLVSSVQRIHLKFEATRRLAESFEHAACEHWRHHFVVRFGLLRRLRCDGVLRTSVILVMALELPRSSILSGNALRFHSVSIRCL